MGEGESPPDWFPQIIRSARIRICNTLKFFSQELKVAHHVCKRLSCNQEFSGKWQSRSAYNAQREKPQNLTDFVFFGLKETERDNMLHKLCHLESFSHFDLRIAQRKRRSWLFPAVHLHKTRPILCGKLDFFTFLTYISSVDTYNYYSLLAQSYGHFRHRGSTHFHSFWRRFSPSNTTTLTTKTTNLKLKQPI